MSKFVGRCRYCRKIFREQYTAEIYSSRFVPVQVVKNLFNIGDIRWRALITFDLMSGLRRGELRGLRWQDVDFDEHTVTIRQTSNYLPGKGIYVSTPKSASSVRPLLLSTAAIMMLMEYNDVCCKGWT